MKITKTQLKQIIKEELEIFEAQWIIDNPTTPKWSPTPKGRAENEAWAAARDKTRRHDYDQIPTMTKTEWRDLEENMDKSGGYWHKLGTEKDPIVMLMLETVGRMASVYEDKAYVGRTQDEFPPVIGKMATLVKDQDWEEIHHLFNFMWMELINWHKDPYYPERSPLPPRVSHNFRTIDTIVRNIL